MISKKKVSADGIKFEYKENGKVLGRAYLYLMRNDLHKEPFGFVEDVFVDESIRGKGIGKALMHDLIKEAKEQKCYKIILTSRYERENVHKFYKDLGFKDHGKEFKMLIEERD